MYYKGVAAKPLSASTTTTTTTTTTTIVSRRDLLDDENNTVADRVSKFHALSFPLKIQGGERNASIRNDACPPYTNTETNRELYDFTLTLCEKCFHTKCNATSR